MKEKCQFCEISLTKEHDWNKEPLNSLNRLLALYSTWAEKIDSEFIEEDMRSEAQKLLYDRIVDHTVIGR